MITLLEIIQRVADALEVRATGTITSVIDNDQVTAAIYPFLTGREAASNRRFEGNELYLTGGAGGAPNPTGIAAYLASTGTLTISPPYTVPPAGPDVTFDIYQRSTSHALFRDCVNRALRQLRYQTQTPVTLVADGDMEEAGTASWSSVNATVTKAAVGGGRGAQALHIVASGPEGGAISAPLDVDARHAGAWYARVHALALGTARLAAYDADTGVEIAHTDWDAGTWGVLELPFTLNSGTERIEFQLLGLENGADIYFDDLIAYPTGATELPLPSWLTNANMVRGVTRGWTGNHRYDALWPLDTRFWELVADESNTANPWRLRTWYTSGPLWLQVARPFPELDGPADETFCDPEWICLAAEVETLKRLAARAMGQEVTPWKERLYGGPGRPGRLTELKIMNSRKMPKHVYLTVPA